VLVLECLLLSKTSALDQKIWLASDLNLELVTTSWEVVSTVECILFSVWCV